MPEPGGMNAGNGVTGQTAGLTTGVANFAMTGHRNGPCPVGSNAHEDNSFATFALSALPSPAHAGGHGKALRIFVKHRQDRPRGLHAGGDVARARRPGARARKTSSGTFEFQRPNRFRFDYSKPFEQTIVADGETLWLYDKDLNQVTLAQAGQGAGLHAGGADRRRARPGALKQGFRPAGAAGPATACSGCRPRRSNKEGQLTSVKVGFRGEAARGAGDPRQLRPALGADVRRRCR